MKLIEQVNILEIAPDPDQPRKDFDPAELQELAESIRTAGVIQPITVRAHPSGTGYMIIAGERRWRAAKLAGLNFIPCILRQDLELEGGIQAVQLLENLHRVDLNPVEKAEFLQRRIELVRNSGVSNAIEAVAAELGVSASWISKNTAILKYSPEIRGLAREGKIRDYALLRRIESLPPEKKSKAINLINNGEFNSKEFFSRRRKNKDNNLVNDALEMARKAQQKPKAKIYRINRDHFIAIAKKTGFDSVLERYSEDWTNSPDSQFDEFFNMFVEWVKE